MKVIYTRSSSYHHWYQEKQVTRGHNIVADGWAGASDPHPYPNPLPTLKHTKSIKNARFPMFQLDDPGRTDEPTDQQTNGRTDGQSLL